MAPRKATTQATGKGSGRQDAKSRNPGGRQGQPMGATVPVQEQRADARSSHTPEENLGKGKRAVHALFDDAGYHEAAEQRREAAAHHLQSMTDTDLEELRQMRTPLPNTQRLLEAVHLILLEDDLVPAVRPEWNAVQNAFQNANLFHSNIRQCEARGLARHPEIIQKLMTDYFAGHNPIDVEQIRNESRGGISLYGWACALVAHFAGLPPPQIGRGRSPFVSMDDLVGELRNIQDQVNQLGEHLQEIDSMGDILSLDSNEMRFADGCAETLATSVMEQLSAWRINKDREIANIYEERVKAYQSLVQSQQEEYDNEADMWALHRKQLSQRLDAVLSDTPKGMRAKRDKYGNDPTARLEMTLDEVLEKLESTRIEPPNQMQTAMDDLSAIIDRKRDRLSVWKTHCTDVTGTRAKELLAEGQTQVEERRGLLSVHLNRRKAALDFLEKALGERKAVLDEVEGWHRWSYSQLLHFRQVAKAAEDEQKLNDDLELVARNMDPGERLPDASIARTRQMLLDRGNEKVEQLRMQLKETLASNLNDDPKDAMPGGPLEAEAWLLDGALTMRKELQRDVVEIGRALTEKLVTVLAGAQQTLVEEEQGSRSLAISFREAQRRILTEQSSWIEDRLRQCMDGSLDKMSQCRRQLEIGLARRSADIQDGARALATKCIAEAESNCLCELTNAALRLLMNSNSAQAELALLGAKSQNGGTLKQIWGRRRTGWENRLDFVRKVLGHLPDNDNGNVAAGAAAQVMKEELKQLRQKLLTMPGGDLLVTLD